MRRNLIFLLLLSLSACAFSQHPANDLYVLKATPPAFNHPTLPMSVVIDAPETAPGLDSERIAVLDTPNHLTHYNNVAWAQPLPQMLQAFLVDGFQQSHAFKNVSDDAEEVTANQLILTDIRDFEVDDNTSPPSTKVSLVIKLVDAKNNKIIATFPVQKTVQAEENHIAHIVTAFNVAANEALAEILQNIGGKAAAR